MRSITLCPFLLLLDFVFLCDSKNLATVSIIRVKMILTVFKPAKHTKTYFTTVATKMWLMLLQDVVAASAYLKIYCKSWPLELELFVDLFSVVAAVIAVVEEGAWGTLCVATCLTGCVVYCSAAATAVLLGMINYFFQLNFKITYLTWVLVCKTYFTKVVYIKLFEP